MREGRAWSTGRWRRKRDFDATVVRPGIMSWEVGEAECVAKWKSGRRAVLLHMCVNAR